MNTLQAINKMLAAISQQPINTLQGNLTSRVIMAQDILEDAVDNEQLTGYYFNTEEDYPLYPDANGEVKVADSIVRADIDGDDEFVLYGQRIYNKTQHTYVINRTLSATIVKRLLFEDLPPVAQRYIVMVAANDFVAKVKQSKELYAYSAQAVAEAKAKLEQSEIETGNFNMLSSFDLRRSL